MRSAWQFSPPGELFFRSLDDTDDPPHDSPFTCPAPSGWRTRRGEEWVEHQPARHQTPDQGWKVHVSAVAADAETVLAETARVAVRHTVVFKHLTTRGRFLARNSKLCAREHAGKFVTLYPPEERLGSLLEDLESALAGHSGPYVLSDRRWRTAPVFLRYGAFTAAAGDDPRSIRAPSGERVPDRRSVRFTSPGPERVPAVLRAWVAAQQGGSGDPLPFEVERALKFSNAGGTYAGRYAGRDVIVKEARPGAGLDPTGRDAVERLEREFHVLEGLSEVAEVPRALAREQVWENTFLVQERAVGVPWHHWASQEQSFRAREPDEVRNRLRRDQQVLDRLEAAVDALHDHGYAHLDLHPGNVLVDTATGAVTLIDLENAVAIDGPAVTQVMAAPGFGLPGEHPPAAYDRYALRQLAQLLLWPSLADTLLDPERSDTVVARIRERGHHLGLSTADPELHTSLARIDRLSDRSPRAGASGRPGRQALTPTPPHLPHPRGRSPHERAADWSRSLVTGLRAARDRLGEHPRHYHALRAGWRGLGYGAAVLDRLVDGVCAAPVPTAASPRRAESHPGLLTGVVGDLVARVGAGPGTGLTAEVLHDLLSAPGSRVFDGRPGVLLGLSLLPEVRSDRTSSDAVCAGVELLARAYLAEPEVFAPLATSTPRRRVGNHASDYDSGLLFGHLGLAWLFARLHGVTDAVVVRACGAALEAELARYVEADGALVLDQGSRTLPYLATGSAGFGVVLGHLPSALWPGRVHDTLSGLLTACEATGSAFPGLAHGYAGLQWGRAGLLATARMSGDGDADPDLALTALLDALPLYAFGLDGGAVVQGDGGGRLTSDLATGGGGVALALRALTTGTYDPLDVVTGLPTGGVGA